MGQGGDFLMLHIDRSAHQMRFFPSPCAERTYLRTAAGINGLRRLKQSAAPSSMERFAPRFAFAECDYATWVSVNKITFHGRMPLKVV